ncbi:MAG: restriction endonuclease subunit S [Calditrichaceae bacterium]
MISKLSKESWKVKNIGDVSSECKNRVDKPKESGYDKFVGLEHFEGGELFIRKNGTTENLNSAMKLFKNGNVLFARRNAYLKRASVVNFDGLCSGDAIVLNQNLNHLIKDFLIVILNTSFFWDYAISNAAGTMSKRVKWRDLAKYNFKLPPKDEQEKILSLFLTIEKLIEQTEAQEKNLRNLITKLSDNLVAKNPEFGHLIFAEQLTLFKLGSIAGEKRESSKNPLAEGHERFVGLEHIEPGNLKITNWGNVADGTTFTKTFKPGDLLFGRRRAYLKKVAVADFSGLCSGDIIVIVPDKNKILPGLFPYYVTAEAVFDYAVSTSAGSLSPRTKWKDLSKFEFSLPPLDVQEKILDVFQSIQNSIDLVHKQHIDLKYLKQNLLDEILG